jgi:hypothetical protein
MKMRVIGFIPPVVGVEEEFNTFRLGSFYIKHLSPGDEVLLLNEKDKLVFGRAVVEKIEAGALSELCLLHAHTNHTQLADEATAAPERLFALLQKIYGPHIVSPSKKATVIFLKRTE